MPDSGPNSYARMVRPILSVWRARRLALAKGQKNGTSVAPKYDLRREASRLRLGRVPPDNVCRMRGNYRPVASIERVKVANKVPSKICKKIAILAERVADAGLDANRTPSLLKTRLCITRSMRMSYMSASSGMSGEHVWLGVAGGCGVGRRAAKET